MPPILKRLAGAAALLAAIAFNAMAADNNTTVVPGSPDMGFDRSRSEQTRRLEMSGDITISGILQAYWLVNHQPSGAPTRTLHLRFFPDQPSLQRLPALLSGKGPATHPRIINLYPQPPLADQAFATAFPLEAVIPLLDSTFPSVPREFFRYHEGQASAQARLRLTRLTALTECDARHFYGDLQAIHPSTPPAAAPAAQLQQLEAAGPCAAQAPYAEYLLLAPTTTTHQQLKVAPATIAATLATLPAGTILLKLKTVDSTWLQVQPLSASDMASGRPKSGTPTGYLPAEALKTFN
jgi:hypothetical protein